MNDNKMIKALLQKGYSEQEALNIINGEASNEDAVLIKALVNKGIPEEEAERIVLCKADDNDNLEKLEALLKAKPHDLDTNGREMQSYVKDYLDNNPEILEDMGLLKADDLDEAASDFEDSLTDEVDGMLVSGTDLVKALTNHVRSLTDSVKTLSEHVSGMEKASAFSLELSKRTAQEMLTYGKTMNKAMSIPQSSRGFAGVYVPGSTTVQKQTMTKAQKMGGPQGILSELKKASNVGDAQALYCVTEYELAGCNLEHAPKTREWINNYIEGAQQ